MIEWDMSTETNLTSTDTSQFEPTTWIYALQHSNHWAIEIPCGFPSFCNDTKG